MNFGYIVQRNPDKNGSTDKGKNLFLGKQILPFKS